MSLLDDMDVPERGELPMQKSFAIAGIHGFLWAAGAGVIIHKYLSWNQPVPLPVGLEKWMPGTEWYPQMAPVAVGLVGVSSTLITAINASFHYGRTWFHFRTALATLIANALVALSVLVAAGLSQSSFSESLGTLWTFILVSVGSSAYCLATYANWIHGNPFIWAIPLPSLAQRKGEDDRRARRGTKLITYERAKTLAEKAVATGKDPERER